MFWIQFFVPNSVVPTFVPNFVTTRHLVLDPISVPNSIVPTFVTIRHLVQNPIMVQVSVPVILFTLPYLIIDRQLAHRLPPNTEIFPPCVELDCS